MFFILFLSFLKKSYLTMFFLFHFPCSSKLASCSSFTPITSFLTTCPFMIYLFIHCFLACLFLYSYLPTHLPICSLLAYLFACFLIVHLHHLSCIACLCRMVIYMSLVQVPTKLIILGSSPPSIWYYPLIYLCTFKSKEQRSQ